MQTIIRQTPTGTRLCHEFTIQEIEEARNAQLIGRIASGRIRRPPNGSIDPSLYGGSEGHHTKNRIGKRN
jgi:hypothetical protein